MKKLIRFDWAIKRLLRDKANPIVLEGFLTSLLGKEIRIIDFLESEGNKRHSEEKSNRVDILAEDAERNKILIEIKFLSTSTIPEDATAPGLKEAREQLSVDRLSREEQNTYYKHLDNMRSLTSAVNTAWEDGEWEGHKKGIEEGREEMGRIIAGNLLRAGMKPEDIAKNTGLSIEEIRKISDIRY